MTNLSEARREASPARPRPGTGVDLRRQTPGPTKPNSSRRAKVYRVLNMLSTAGMSRIFPEDKRS